MRNDASKHPIRNAALALAAFCLATTTFAAQANTGTASGATPSVGRATLPTLLPTDVPASDQSSGQAGGEASTGNLKTNEFGQSLTSDAVVQYDSSTDSVIVVTDDKTNENIGRVIKAMDEPVPQALIKVAFIQVTYNNELDVGVEATLAGNTAIGNNNSLSATFGVASGLINAAGTVTTSGVLYHVLDHDVSAYLRMLQTSGRTEVLSRPSVLVRNNQQATITVGQNIPFVTNSTITDTGQTQNTIEYKDVGIILIVQPRISANGMIQMYINPEISSISSDTVKVSDSFTATVIDKRSAETYVVVPDAKTVVIGGMMQDQTVRSEEKIPFLGQIPYLGWLFGVTTNKKVKTELLIFLTPYIASSSQKMESVSTDEINRADLPSKYLSQHQYNRFIDNIGGGQVGWKKQAK
jgi:general secretion pathway protein D